MWVHYTDMKASYGAHNILVMRYENLQNETMKVAELQRLSDFLHIRTTKERLHCAYLMGTKAKRNVTTSHNGREEGGEDHTTSTKIGPMMTKEGAYTEELACEMWQLFGKAAKGAGYTSFGTFDCSDYYPIRRAVIKFGEEQDTSKISTLAKAIAVGKRRKSAMGF